MLDKLTSTVEVKTLMVSVRCPNNQCVGVLKADGKERTENGIHGGRVQYRHACEACSAGYWLNERYPKIKYEPVETAALPIKKNATAAPTGKNVVPRTEE
jgi:hypothetical protein